MAEKHLKKCSVSLVIREMQIKTTLRFHLTLVRMAKIKNSGDSRCWRGCEERGTLLHCWWELPAGTITLEISLAVPLKTGHLTSRRSCYTTPGHIPRGFPPCNKDTCSTMFIAALSAGKNPGIPQQKSGCKKCGISTQWSTIQPLETMNS